MKYDVIKFHMCWAIFIGLNFWTLHAPILELAEGYFLSTFSFNFTRLFDVFRVSGDLAWDPLLYLQESAKVLSFNRPPQPFYKSLQSRHSWPSQSHSTLYGSDILNGAEFVPDKENLVCERKFYFWVRTT